MDGLYQAWALARFKLLPQVSYVDVNDIRVNRAPFVAPHGGQDLISLLAGSWKKPVAVGHCDFRNLKIEGVTIPENAVIFTSYAVHYVPQLSMDFVRFLSRLKPRAVVHFEPCYEFFTADSLHQMMCRRYMELNDYGRNLVTVIEAGRQGEGISVRTRKYVFGSNPFLPISVIEWAPAGRSEVLQ